MKPPPLRFAPPLVALWLLGAAPARAQTAPDERAAGPAVDVAVLAPARDDRVLVEAAARVRLELGASGLTSAAVETAGDAYAARIAFVREDGVATIDLLGTLADGSPLDRRVRVPREDGGDDPAVLALRATEILRGMRLAARPRAVPTPAAPAPALVVEPEPPLAEPSSASPVQLLAGVAAIEGRLTGAGAGVAPGLTLGLSAAVTPAVAIVATVAGPFYRDLETTPSGSAHTREELGLFGLRLTTDRPVTNVSLLLAAGAHHLKASPDERGFVMMTAAQLRVRGAASVWSPCVALGVGVSRPLWRHVGIATALVAVILQPTLDITIDGRSVGGAGAPSLLQTIDLWAAFP